MSNFNFSLNDTEVSSNVQTRLKPYTITEITSITADKKEGSTWKAVEITFNSANGVHKEMMFIPDEENGTTRRKWGEVEFPSNWENFKQAVAHILGVYYPDGFEKFKEYVTKVKSIEQFADGFIKILNKAPENKTNLKLVGRNNKGTVYATLPSACYIIKDDAGNYTDKVRPNNFLGDNLTFTPSELKKQAEYANAKPTPMPSETSADLEIDTAPKGSEDDDLEALFN